MKVAHVITRMIVGGAQENTLHNCQDLVELHGDDVLLITGPALGPEGDLLERHRGPLHFKVHMIDSLRRAIHPTRDWRAYREVQAALRQFQPDVVHTHSAKGGVLGRLAGWKRNTPAVVHTVHGAPFHKFQPAFTRNVYRWCETYAARRCHRLICVADAMTDLMVDGGVAPRDRFITIYSGMDVDPFLNANDHRDRVRREFGFADDDLVIGKIARLFHLKGHEYVLEAAKTVCKRNPRVRLFFVGNGLLRDSLEAKIRELGLEGRVVFAGLVDPVRIPEMIGAMDLLVHASLREGLARALPQALIAGKPAISFDVDGAREVVLDGETGRLLPAEDVAGLTEAMLQLAGDADLRERLGSEGRRRFTDQFRHQTMTKHIRDVYEQLLNGGAP